MLSLFSCNKDNRKRYRAVLFLLLVTTFILAVSANGISAAAASDKGTLLVLGDSIATGHSLPDYNSSGNPKSQYSWATLLAKAYGAKQVNLAVDGNTTSDLLRVVQNAANRQAISQAKVICISIGGNNFLQMMGRLFAENEFFASDVVESTYVLMQAAAENDLDGIFTALKELNPDAKVLVQTMFEPYRYFTVPIAPGKTLADWMGDYVDRYNTVLKSKAESYGYTIVDVADAFQVKGQENWLYASMSEGTLDEAIKAISQANSHPTKEGHQGIFETYRSTADEILLAAFVDNPVSTEPEVPTESEQSTEPEQSTSANHNNASTDNPEKNKNQDHKIMIGIGLGVVFVASVCVFILNKKKRA